MILGRVVSLGFNNNTKSLEYEGVTSNTESGLILTPP